MLKIYFLKHLSKKDRIQKAAEYENSISFDSFKQLFLSFYDKLKVVKLNRFR